MLSIFQVKCVNKSTSYLGHKGVVYNLKAKEFNTSGPLGGIKNDLCIGTRPDPFLQAICQIKIMVNIFHLRGILLSILVFMHCHEKVHHIIVL